MADNSRRRARTPGLTPGRRLTMAAAAVLAGAAVPIAAAGTAWADETIASLEEQAKVDAKEGIPVDLSVDGRTVINTCGTACTADSGRGDAALVVGSGSADDSASGDGRDTAYATNGSTATIVSASDSSAIATGGATAQINGGGVNDTHDLADASGTGSVAVVNLSGYSSATATGTGDQGGAFVEESTDGKATAVGTGSIADVGFSHASSATAENTGGTSPNGATVLWGVNSSATAEGAGSVAGILGASPAAEVAVSRASAEDGGTALVVNSGSAPFRLVVRGDVAVASGAGSGAGIADSRSSSLAVSDGNVYSLRDVTDQHVVHAPVASVEVPVLP